MKLSKLALRNLLRSPRRTVITTISIVVGVWLAILGQGFVEGLDESLIVAATDGTVGHVMARPADYPTQSGQHPVDALLTINDATRRLLEEEAVAWTERTYFAPTVAHGRDSLRLVAIAFDPERDASVFPRAHWKVDGELPTTDEVTVSRRVASLLRVEPGDTVVLQNRTHRGAMNALSVTVSGVVTTGNPALDRLGMFVPRELASKLLSTDLPSHLAVKLRSRDGAEAFAPRLQTALGEQAETITWVSETAELLALQEVRVQSINMVVFVLLILAGLGIANTILMAAHERIREVGTLRSLGMTEGGVVRLFLLEGALIGLAGGLVGALLGSALASYWARNPIDLSAMMEQQGATYSASTLLYTQLNPATVATSVVLAVVVAVLASLYPARVASRMVPADAVRSSQ